MSPKKPIHLSVQKKKQRRKNRPALTFDPALPITEKKDEIIAAIRRYPVVIISGETGSGKSTQIPKFCLAAGRGIAGRIGCTQPRRIAASAIARRIAEELKEPLGRTVGYKIRFRDATAKETGIKIMTDGILLAETQNDPYLNEYDTIIVDEAHERSLNIDFILGILKSLITKRSQLKLVITSATIDTRKFSEAFDGAPIIEVSGRMYPVEVIYFPFDLPSDESNEPPYIEKALAAVDKIFAKSLLGDILIFMPTEQDIHATCELLNAKKHVNTMILPLYAKVPSTGQSRVFAATGKRKVIVATNVAETSITIPGIKYVVDTGLARIPRYTPRTRTTALPIVPVSKSSADQRKGRCGRVENGICYRLFSEADYNERPAYTTPEILRSNLAEVILRMIALNLGDISNFPFIDRPVPKSIKDGFDLLLELGAIQREIQQKSYYQLTRRGRRMARIPLDPRLSRMLIEARHEGCLHAIIIIVAGLSIQDPRERPVEAAKQADQLHAVFRDNASDFVTRLNIWNGYHESMRKAKSKSQARKKARQFCRDHFLSYKRMWEWNDIYIQIKGNVSAFGFRDGSAGIRPQRHPESGLVDPWYAAIHRSILSGFLSNIAVKKEGNIFKTGKGRDIMIFPGSGLFNNAGKWIVSAEMVETSRLFARNNAKIDHRWLEKLGGPLCKYAYFNPRWNKNRGQVVVDEQVSLFGLVIVHDRPVPFRKIDPEAAGDIFIREALVARDINEKFSFIEHNRKRIDEIDDIENRLRRRDLLIDTEAQVEFYRRRLKGVCDVRTLKQHLKKRGADDHLRMTSAHLLRYRPAEEELSRFPDTVVLGRRPFKCAYAFHPGKETDGVTVKIPYHHAAAIPATEIDWLVPGLFREKIALLIKGLPKRYRKRLSPAAAAIEVIVEEMPRSAAPLLSQLGEFIFQRFGVDIPGSAWPERQLPDHLKMRVSITGPDGAVLFSGRDKALLSRKASGPINPADLDPVREKWERQGITAWDFETIPEKIDIKGAGDRKWIVFPALEENPECPKSVNLRLFDRRHRAMAAHIKGVGALYRIYFSKDLKYLIKMLTLPPSLKLVTAYFGGQKKFERNMAATVTDALFFRNIRTRQAFYSHAENVAPLIREKGRALMPVVIPVLNAFREAITVIEKLETEYGFNHTATAFFDALRKALHPLVPENFMQLYDANRLACLVRYIKAVAVRAERAVINFDKDRIKAETVDVFKKSLNELVTGLTSSSSAEKRNALEEYFWMIEEYKVSVFAQEIGTAFPVSKKRLGNKLAQIKRMR